MIYEGVFVLLKPLIEKVLELFNKYLFTLIGEKRSTCYPRLCKIILSRLLSLILLGNKFFNIDLFDSS